MTTTRFWPSSRAMTSRREVADAALGLLKLELEAELRAELVEVRGEPGREVRGLGRPRLARVDPLQLPENGFAHDRILARTTGELAPDRCGTAHHTQAAPRHRVGRRVGWYARLQPGPASTSS